MLRRVLSLDGIGCFFLFFLITVRKFYCITFLDILAVAFYGIQINIVSDSLKVACTV
jgi:hypothetical protein